MNKILSQKCQRVDKVNACPCAHYVNLGTWRDCLNLLALNVTTVECFKNFGLYTLKPPHSARRSLKRNKPSHLG